MLNVLFDCVVLFNQKVLPCICLNSITVQTSPALMLFMTNTPFKDQMSLSSKQTLSLFYSSFFFVADSDLLRYCSLRSIRDHDWSMKLQELLFLTLDEIRII